MTSPDSSSTAASAPSTSAPVTGPSTTVEQHTDAPHPPDMIGNGSVHVPGHAPSRAILDGPAVMVIGGGKNKKNAGKSSGAKKS